MKPMIPSWCWQTKVHMLGFDETTADHCLATRHNSTRQITVPSCVSLRKDNNLINMTDAINIKFKLIFLFIVNAEKYHDKCLLMMPEICCSHEKYSSYILEVNKISLVLTELALYPTKISTGVTASLDLCERYV